ncbi:MAG: hypothetical protein CM15mP88_0940 [Pseudomonadota bacterium]|nr:MAG: hypothetical protein CM15mP88_0940 [Pseudomonadota bacterium]
MWSGPVDCCDEPTTALDVTIQAQILRLLSELVEEEKMSLILITHDLGVIAENTDRMLVMYAGRCVESGLTEDVFSKLKHPYTRGLFEALPEGEQQHKGEFHPFENHSRKGPETG